jgi:hypothetical protein
MHLSIEGIRRIALPIACSSMAPHSQSRGRKEEEEERKKKLPHKGMTLAHMNRNKEGPATRGIIHKSWVCPSYSSLHLNFRFYLYVLSPQSNYAPLDS